MSRFVLTDAQRKAVEREIDKQFTGSRAEYEKFRVLCGPKVEPRQRKRMERFFKLRDKGADIVSPVYNHAQRKLFSIIQRQWRKGLPARVIICKPRQTGFSTAVQHLLADETMQKSYRRAAVIAHKRDISAKVMQMYQVVLRNLPYKIPTRSESRDRVTFDEPLHSSIDLDSAESDDPGHGDTVQLLHCTEVSRWRDAERKMKGLLNTVPDLPGTLVVVESTANGAQGYFFDLWQAAVRGESGFVPLFVAWFEHEEYTEKRLSDSHRQHIKDTLTSDEEALLKMNYHKRGRGTTYVTYEQLAWRRRILTDKCNGDLDVLHEQYPATPEEAFLASGRPVFDPATLEEIRRNVVPIVFRGDIEDLDFKHRDEPSPMNLEEAIRSPREDVTIEYQKDEPVPDGLKEPVRSNAVVVEHEPTPYDSDDMHDEGDDHA